MTRIVEYYSANGDITFLMEETWDGEDPVESKVEFYKGFGIDYNIYGKEEYTVQADGDDFWFTSVEDARNFIDTIA